MDITERYLALVDQERWGEALPLIEEIVDRAPHIATSWFNYGVCLEALDRFADAATAFENAYSREEENFRAQYRVFRSLALARDEDRFLRFLDAESQKIEGMFDQIEEDDTFAEFIASPAYATLKKRRG